jgi:hypothetical protein
MALRSRRRYALSLPRRQVERGLRALDQQLQQVKLDRGSRAVSGTSATWSRSISRPGRRRCCRSVSRAAHRSHGWLESGLVAMVLAIGPSSGCTAGRPEDPAVTRARLGPQLLRGRGLGLSSPWGSDPSTVRAALVNSRRPFEAGHARAQRESRRVSAPAPRWQPPFRAVSPLPPPRAAASLLRECDSAFSESKPPGSTPT